MARGLETGIEKVVLALLEGSPAFVLPLPPSDNRRLMAARGSSGRLILSPEARAYLSSVRLLACCGDWTHSEGHVVMAYQCLFPTLRRRDAGNCMKILKDALFEEDKNVLGWELPPRRGVPKTELQYPEKGDCLVWLFRLP